MWEDSDVQSTIAAQWWLTVLTSGGGDGLSEVSRGQIKPGEDTMFFLGCCPQKHTHYVLVT